MELRQLKYFLAVAGEGSISGAAERLFITQPSLSRQMQSLESEAGQPLFVRGNRRITLTEAGKLLQKRAQEILQLYDRTVDELSAPEADVRGEVFIGGGESRAMQTLIRAAIDVQSEYPAVRFAYYSGDASAITERLDKGLADFGVVLDVPDLSAYESLPLPLGDRWGALMRSDDKLASKSAITPQDLEGEKIICSVQAAAKGLMHKWAGDISEKFDIVATYNLLYVGSQLAEEGAGYVIGLENIAATEGRDLKFVPLAPSVHTSAAMIWKKYAPLSKPCQLFLQAVRKRCAEEPEK